MKIQPDALFSNATVVIGPGDYFVNAIDGQYHYLMAGPYASYADADADIRRVKSICYEHDCRGCFMAWGVARLPPDSGEVGKLNQLNLLERESNSRRPVHELGCLNEEND